MERTTEFPRAHRLKYLLFCDLLWQDVRHASRSIWRSRGLATALIATLALGIGINTSVFSCLDRLVLKPLPVPESDRLVRFYYQVPSTPGPYDSVSYPDYVFYRGNNTVFAGLAAYAAARADFRFGDRTEAISGEIVSWNYFSVLGRFPVIGRAFSADEDAVPGRNPVLVLGYELWRRRFGGDRRIVGQEVVVNRTRFTVVGVAPEGFGRLWLDRAAEAQFWAPTMMYPAFFDWGDLAHYRGNQWLSAIGRLRPGVSLAQADANVSYLTEQLKATEWKDVWKEADDAMRGSVFLLPADEARISPDARKTVLGFFGMLMAVAGLVLLIACANVANLMLARAIKRRKEIAIRLALGISKSRLFQELVTESMLLSLLAGAAGLLAAYVAMQYFQAMERPLRIPLLLDAGLDARMLGVSLILATLTGLLFGVIPLHQASRVNLVSALKLDSGFARRRLGFRDALVVVQVAVSVMLLVGAGLFVRTLRNAQGADATVSPERVLMLSLDLRAQKYDPPRGRRFYSEVLDRAQALTGVQRAALVAFVPLGGSRGGTDVVTHPGRPPQQVDFNVVSDQYFQTIGFPLQKGRAFEKSDGEGSAKVAIVNVVMADRFWPGQAAIGNKVRLHGSEDDVEIVGVVHDGKFRDYRAAVKPCLYVPFAQHYMDRMSLEVRTAADPRAVAPFVQGQVLSLDRNIPLPGLTTLQAFRDARLGPEKLAASLLSALGVLGLSLAAVGLYAVQAFSVEQRTSEIGIRMALGATPEGVLRAVLSRSLAILVIGMSVGLAGAYPLAKLLSSFLYEVGALDAETYVLSVCVLLLVGLAAAYRPAAAAARIDPIRALRHE